VRASSVGDIAKGDMIYSEVRFNWYCLERPRSHIDYSVAIADYTTMADRERRQMERTVDRLLSEDEAALLREYLQRSYRLGLEVEEVPLPLRTRSYLFEEGSSVIYDFLELSEREGYDLPFKVWGYYTLAHSLGSPSMENGIRLLRNALERLKISRIPPDDELKMVLSAIYREDGLYVKKRETASRD